MKVLEALTKNLIKLRKSKNLTQEDLAEKSDLSVKVINALENGRQFCGLDTIKKLAKALNIEETALFKDDSLFDAQTALKVLENEIKK